MTDAIEITVAVLAAASAVKTIVGPRNYPIKFPQNAQPPCNVINIVGDHDEEMLSGPGGYFESRVRIESIDLDAEGALALSKAVYTAMTAVIKGAFGAATDVDIIYLMQTTSSSDERQTCMVVSDFSVRWRS